MTRTQALKRIKAFHPDIQPECIRLLDVWIAHGLTIDAALEEVCREVLREYERQNPAEVGKPLTVGDLIGDDKCA